MAYVGASAHTLPLTGPLMVTGLVPMAMLLLKVRGLPGQGDAVEDATTLTVKPPDHPELPVVGVHVTVTALLDKTAKPNHGEASRNTNMVRCGA